MHQYRVVIEGRGEPYEKVASSSYTDEWPIPLRVPAVASERWINKPPSDRPAFRMRIRRTSRLVRKSEELDTERS